MMQTKMPTSMQQLKKYVSSGQIQLANLDQNNKPVKMQISQLQQKTTQINKNQRIYKIISILSWEQKYEWVNTKRLKANQFYRNNQIKQAIETYLQCLIGLELKHQDKQKNKTVVHQLKFPILLNIASCFYKQKKYQNGLEICDQILKDQFGKDFIPALYKKSYFYYQLGKYQKAKEIAINIFKLLQSNGNNDKKITKNDVQQLFGNILLKTKQERKVYKKIFGQQQQEQNTSNNNKNKPSQQQILIYDQNILQRSFLWIKNLFECCYKKRSKQYIQEEQEEKVNFLKDKSR